MIGVEFGGEGVFVVWTIGNFFLFEAFLLVFLDWRWVWFELNSMFIYCVVGKLLSGFRRQLIGLNLSG